MNTRVKRLSVLSVALSSVVWTGFGWADTAPATSTATPAPAATAAPAAAAAPTGSVEVMRAVLTKDVTNHDPGEEITTAKVGDVVAGWNQISSGTGDVTIHHKWLHEGQLVSDVPLAIKGSPYRTWSRKTLSEPGAWKWQITTDAGDVLKEISFTVSQ